MALALLWPDSTVLYLDAVTNYTKSYNSRISNHPIDSSLNVITDHVSKSNPTLTIRGIVSAADFHSTDQRPQELLESTEFSIDSEYNNPVNGVEISQRSNLLDFLPGSIQQFLGSTNPSTVSLDEFRGYSHESARDKLNKAWENSERLTLLDYNVDTFTGRSVSVRSFSDAIIERFEDNEDVETGDSLQFTLTLKKVRIAFIKEIDVTINQQPASGIADAAAGESNEGDQSIPDPDSVNSRLIDESGSALQRGVRSGAEFIGIPQNVVDAFAPLPGE